MNKIAFYLTPLLKKIFVLFAICFLFMQNIRLNAFAEESLIDSCYKEYNLSADNMFTLSLAALNSLKYDIVEIQSKSGYILFTSSAKEYLLTVSSTGTNNSGIKILPTNSNFSNGTVVQAAIFNALETKKTDILKKVQ